MDTSGGHNQRDSFCGYIGKNLLGRPDIADLKAIALLRLPVSRAYIRGLDLQTAAGGLKEVDRPIAVSKFRPLQAAGSVSITTVTAHIPSTGRTLEQIPRGGLVVRIVLKAWLVLAAFAAAIASIGLCWFYFYSGDLPHFEALANLVPDSAVNVSDYCSGTPIRVIPSALVGNNLRSALRAAEGQNDEMLALQVSRKLFCNSRMRMLKRHLLEYKASAMIRRRFRREQLVTIYLNQADFGKDLVGAENACLRLYGKHASDLDIAQAAMIAGLLKSPTLYSPERHPDRARERRDSVIQGMLGSGTITAEQAEAAEQSAIH